MTILLRHRLHHIHLIRSTARLGTLLACLGTHLDESPSGFRCLDIATSSTYSTRYFLALSDLVTFDPKLGALGLVWSTCSSGSHLIRYRPITQLVVRPWLISSESVSREGPPKCFAGICAGESISAENSGVRFMCSNRMLQPCIASKRAKQALASH